MGMTITEKILATRSGREKVVPGEIVNCSVDIAMSHDATLGVLSPFNSIGVQKVWDPEKIVVLMDHWNPPNNEQTATGYKIIRQFVKQQNIKHFYDISEGICHQILPEKGHVVPGSVIVGTDSHTNTAGAFGSFATGIGFTDMAAVFSSGKIWLKVPPTIKVVLSGQLKPWVGAKDIILYLASRIGVEGATYKALEFAGPVVEEMDISGRMTLCNMSVELGAKNGIVAPDARTVRYLKDKVDSPVDLTGSDDDAGYEKVIELDVGDMDLQVAFPDSPGNSRSIREIDRIKIDQAFVGSCTNGRLEDLREASRILKGRKVHPEVRLLVIPASRNIAMQAVREGITEVLLEAGAVVMHPTCGPCIGAQLGLLAAGEVCISSTNRNFRGRMGSSQSDIYLSNPAVVAASALKGYICNPEEVL